MKKVLWGMVVVLFAPTGAPQMAIAATVAASTPPLLTYLGNKEWKYQLPVDTVLLSVVFKGEAALVKTSIWSNFVFGPDFFQGPILHFDDTGCAPVDLEGTSFKTATDYGLSWHGSVCRLFSQDTTGKNTVEGLYIPTPASGRIKAPWAQSMTVIYYALGENEVKLFKADSNGVTSDKPAPALANTGIRYDKELKVDSVSNMMLLGMFFQRAPGWKVCGRLDVFDTLEDAPGGLCRFDVAGISTPENPHTAEVWGELGGAWWSHDNVTDIYGGVWAGNVTLAYAGEDGEVRILKADLPFEAPVLTGTLIPVTSVLMVVNGSMVDVINTTECTGAVHQMQQTGIPLSVDVKAKCILS